MNDNLKTLSMLEIAEVILRDNKQPMTVHEIIKSVVGIKNISLDDVDKLTQLYMDITQSAKFVYCGDDQWDLKERNLELWDKDGFAFVHADEIEEDVEEDLDFKEFVLEDDDEEEVVFDDEEEEDASEDIDLEIVEEKEYIDIDLPIKSTDDDDNDDDIDLEFDDEDYDEDDYNEIMDDYEDLYEE
jgi:DNA-directed RNA polymerase subunit delta